METTKVIAEYLIVGTLICLAVVFLAFNIAPDDVQVFVSGLAQSSSSAITGLIAIFLPIAYGVGIITDYLGMVLYENSLREIKDKRFSQYVDQNQKWLNRSPLLSNYAKTDVSLVKGAGDRIYGELRFFILMHNTQLYAEVEGQINQARILRALTIVESLFLIGFVIQFLREGINFIPLLSFTLILVFLLFSREAVKNRFNRYCRAIERSYKVLVLEQIRNKPGRDGKVKPVAASGAEVRV